MAASKRSMTIVGVILVIAAAVGVAHYLGYLWPRGGPLGGEAGNTYGRGMKGLFPRTLAFQPRDNRGQEAAVLVRAVLLGPDGSPYPRKAPLKVLGVKVFDGCRGGNEGSCEGRLSWPGWPPRNVRLVRLKGYSVAPGDDVVVTVGVRPKFPGKYQMRGVLLEYRVGIRRYRTEVGPRVVLRVPEN